MFTTLIPALIVAAAAAANDAEFSKLAAGALPVFAVDGRDSACSIARDTTNHNIARSSDSGRDSSVEALFKQAA